MPARGLFALVVLAASLFAAGPEPAKAQNAQNQNAQNLVLVPLEATINQNALMRQELAPPPKRQSTLRGRLGEPIAGVPPEKLAETRFTLRAVDFQGLAAVPLDPAVLAAAWKDLIGKEISLLDLGKALEKIEDLYKQHDYVVIAKVPPQEFASGRIRIVAYEVYVSEYEVKGDTGRLRGRLDPILERIKAMHPLRHSQIYRQLLIMEDLVGGEISADWFQVDNMSGAARLEVTVPAYPGNLLLTFDNYGGANIGPLQASARARINDMFGLFDGTDINVLANPSNPARIAYVGFQQAIPLGLTGFSLSYGVANSWSNPAGLSELVNLHSEVLIANVSLNYALLREIDRNVIVSIGVNGNNSSTDVLGQALTRDRTRWVSVGAKYDDVIGGVRLVLNPVFLHGVDAFEANVPFADFQVATLSGGATTNLTDTLTAQLLVSAQYAFGTLPAAVLGFYGGETLGRSYDPGALAGNNLLAGGFQLTQKIDTHLSWLPELSLFGFIDYGAAWNPPPAGAAYEYSTLSSAGFGLRAGIGERLVATGLVAQPLTYDTRLAALGIEQNMRLRFTLGLRF
jgi:hemolysin activation/secretion protein